MQTRTTRRIHFAFLDLLKELKLRASGIVVEAGKCTRHIQTEAGTVNPPRQYLIFHTRCTSTTEQLVERQIVEQQVITKIEVTNQSILTALGLDETHTWLDWSIGTCSDKDLYEQQWVEVEKQNEM